MNFKKKYKSLSDFKYLHIKTFQSDDSFFSETETF